jgi:hypothetical protein
MVRETFEEEEWDLLYIDTLLMSSYGCLSDIPAVLDLRDVFSTYHEKAMALSRSLVTSLYHRIQKRKHTHFLTQSLERFDSVLVCTDSDAQQLFDIAPEAAVHVVPNGVDSDYFQPMDEAIEPQSIVFVGSMDYFPNVDGVLHFVRQVFPALRERFPDIRLYVVGRNPTRQIRQLNDGEHIIVTGEVPDVRPYVARSSVSICPTRVPTGIQNKILLTMAMGKPVVCTVSASVGSETSLQGLYTAEDRNEFAEMLAELLEDPGMARSMGAAARAEIVRRYQWSRILDNAQSLLEKVPRDAGFNT